MKALLYSVWAILIVAAAVHAEHYGKSITTDSAAIAAANEITGLGEYYAQRGSAPAVASVTPTIYRDSTTPFLHDSLDGLPAWEIVYSGIEDVLEGLSDSMQVEREPTTLVIWIDSSQGTILRCHIASDYPVDESPMMRASELEPIRRAGGNVFSGIPSDVPEIDMLGALATWGEFSLGARFIVVRYVTMTAQHSDPFAGWNLVFPGIYMKPSDYPDAVYAVDVWVDARSGSRSPTRQISGPAVGSPDAKK